MIDSGPIADGPPELHATALKLWVVLSRAQAAVARLSRADIERHGLAQAEFAALEALYHVGPLLLGDLQDKVLKSSGGMTYVVDRLEEKGLVSRRRCPEDRRAVYAELTPAGRTLLERIFPLHAAAIADAVAGLDGQDQERAIALLRTLGRAAAERPLPGRDKTRAHAGPAKETDHD